MTRKGIGIVAGLAVFALNWAALHDIIKAREPDLRAEHTVVILTVLGLLAWGMARVLRMRRGEKGSR